eukprot:3099825-Prymnesium_polylepis.1
MDDVSGRFAPARFIRSQNSSRSPPTCVRLCPAGGAAANLPGGAYSAARNGTRTIHVLPPVCTAVYAAPLTRSPSRADPVGGRDPSLAAEAQHRARFLGRRAGRGDRRALLPEGARAPPTRKLSPSAQALCLTAAFSPCLAPWCSWSRCTTTRPPTPTRKRCTTGAAASSTAPHDPPLQHASPRRTALSARHAARPVRPRPVSAGTRSI